MAAVLALIAAVGWGSSDFAAGSASRRSTAESVVLFTHFVAALCLLPLALIGGTPASRDLVWGIGAGLGGALGALLLYRGLAKGLMAVVAPVTAAGAATIPVVFGLARGERITVIGLAGVALALGAIVLMSLSPSQPGSVESVKHCENPFDRPPLIGSRVDAYSVSTLATGTDVHIGAPSAAADEASVDPKVDAKQVDIADDALVWRRPWIVPTLMIGAVLLAAATAVTPTIAALAAGTDLPTGGLMTLVFAGGTTLVVLVGIVVLLPVMMPPRRVTSGSGGRRRVLRQPGLVDAVFSGVGFGMFFVALSQTSTDAGMWPLVSARGTSVMLFIGAAGLAGVAITPAAETRGSILVAGVFDAVAAISFLLASQRGLLAVAAVLSSLYPGVTVLLARVVTKERCGRMQLVGMAVAGSSIGLLALT